MCTAVSFKTKNHYFGRNLDLEYSYDETVTITPRNFPFKFRHVGNLETHYAIIGVAYVAENYPLYYDAVNEKGLGVAGLNFAGNAVWSPFVAGKDNVTPFELIPWILGQCASVDEARERLSRVNALNENFSEKLPLSPLHWLVSDAEKSLTVEFLAGGLKLSENPVGVLTNNPPFEFQLLNLANYMQTSREPIRNTLAPELKLDAYSRGMGAFGLPGDLSSASRFVKAAFTKLNSVCGNTEAESVSQFFHILGSVDQQKGCVHLGGDKYEITIYSSCCNTETGVFYYRTYGNSAISCVDMHRENLNGNELVSYPLIKEQRVRLQNGGELDECVPLCCEA